MPLVGLEPTRPKAPRPQRDTSTIPSQGLFLERSYREEGKTSFSFFGHISLVFWNFTTNLI